MSFLKHSILGRALVMVCIAAHILAVLPHHHHGGSELPCVNALHCVAHGCMEDAAEAGCGVAACPNQGCGDSPQVPQEGCCAGHSHDGGQAGCSFDRAELLLPDRNDRGDQIAYAFIPAAFLSGFTVSEALSAGYDRHNILLQGDYFLLNEVLPVSAYLVSRISPRAPSFSV